MQVRVVARAVSHDLEATVRDDLVRVHVGRGARAALDDADDELVVPLALDDLLADAVDHVGLVRAERAELAIRARRRLLDHGQRHDQVGIVEDGAAGDRKVLKRPRGVDAPVGVRRNLPAAE